MKYVVMVIAQLMLGMSLNAQTGHINIKITEIVAEWGGAVTVGLFNKEGFPKSGEAVVTRNLPVRGIQITTSFRDIPVGDYAIAVYQDVNSDHKLNRTIYGQPTEPYGFSQNSFGRFGPPKFEAVAFSVSSNQDLDLKITLKE